MHPSFQSINPGEAQPLNPTRPAEKTFAWKRIIGEFVGSLCFAFVGVLVSVLASAAASPADPRSPSLLPTLMTAAANALILCGLFFATVRLSGGHLNPVVSVCAFVISPRRMTFPNTVMYVAAQCAGALGGTALVLACVPSAADAAHGRLDAPEMYAGFSIGQAFVVELFLSFVVIFVASAVLLNPLKSATEEIPFPWRENASPVALSLVFFAAFMCSGLVSGSYLNPARALASALLAGIWSHAYIFLIAPFCGAILAALLWEQLLGPDSRPF